MSDTTTTRKRAPGAGRKPKHGAAMPEQIGVRATAETAATLRKYNQSEAVRLLASGLRLGAGNLPDLLPDEVDALRYVLSGSVVDALFVRCIVGELLDSDHPAAARLAAKLNTPGIGDWERLALVLRHG